MRDLAARFLPALAGYGIPRLSVKDSLLDVHGLDVLVGAMVVRSPGAHRSATTKVVPP